MALPFLPSSIIRQTYALLKKPEFLLNESFKLNKLLKYFKKRWLNHIDSEELSTYNSDVTTNNGAESYHAKLKAIIKTAHPRIWTFVSILNHIIEDTNNELGRLQRGKVITRPRKLINIFKEERRKFYKEMLQSSVYTPLQYLHSMAHTVGSFPYVQLDTSDFSETSDDETVSTDDVPPHANICVVCLCRLTITWIFMPCRHANCCSRCSETIEVLQHPCPVCRAPIESRLEIFI